MKKVFSIGDEKEFSRVVSKEDTAQFNGEEVHPFYGTYALGRDAEWACRLFVLDIVEEGEEGIGTYLNIKHLEPAVIGDKVWFLAQFGSLVENHLHCTWSAKVGDKVIAKGSTGQMILSPRALERLYQKAMDGKK